MQSVAKVVAECAITIGILLVVGRAVLRFTRPMMLNALGPDTQENRDRVRRNERITMWAIVALGLIGCVVGLLLPVVFDKS